MSLIVGNQCASRFPTKRMANINVVRTHVTGVINHGWEATADVCVMNPTGEMKEVNGSTVAITNPTIT
jgi:hypothetical protein